MEDDPICTPELYTNWCSNPIQVTGKVDAEQPTPSPHLEPPQDDPTFFHDVEEAARKTLERETRHENYKATAAQVCSTSNLYNITCRYYMF